MLVSAEIGQAADGSLGTMLAYVRAIAAAGADCVKVQDHRGDQCSRFRPGTERDFPQDIDRQSYWRRTGYSQEHWFRIRESCLALGVDYIVSPFSMKAFEQQADLQPDRWKIASSKVNDHELIDACAKTGKPVILSTGMSTWAEIDAAVTRIPREQLTILDCVSEYPTPPEKINMQTAGVMDVRYFHATPLRCGTGISDHSGTIWPSICAAYIGLAMTEVHVVFSRECFGPDVTSSITTAELRQLVEGVGFIERMSENAVSKDQQAAELKEVREVFCA